MIKYRRCASILCDNIIYPHQLAWKKGHVFCCQDCQYLYDTIKHAMGIKPVRKPKIKTSTQIIINNVVIGREYKNKIDPNLVLTI